MTHLTFSWQPYRRRPAAARAATGHFGKSLLAGGTAKSLANIQNAITERWRRPEP
jgi:hypothetical protein